MRCPRCVQRIHRAASSCPHCGFTIADADELFGSEEAALQKFTDSAGVLRMKDREPMRKILERFEARFPQLFVSIYVGAFEELPSIRQFGFWLLNRAAFTDVDLDRPNENGILIVADVNGRNVGVTYGYSLMPYLDDESTFDALSAAHPFLLQGEYLFAFQAMIGKFEATLKKGWRRAKKDPESMLAVGGQNPKKVSELLKGIRSGNQPRRTAEDLNKEEEEVST